MSKFCMYCGKEMPDVAMFCVGCGKEFESSFSDSKQPSQIANQNTDDIIENLKKCKEIFEPMQEKYDCRNEKQVNLAKNNNKSYGIVVTVALLFVFFMLAKFIGNTLTELHINPYLITFGMFFILVGVPMLILKNDKKRKETTLARLNKELEEYYQSKDLSVKLAFEYSDPRIIELLIKNINSGRADTIKEAINCMHDDQYRAETLKILKDTQKSADATAFLALGILLRLD